jgi:hypothetical protein
LVLELAAWGLAEANENLLFPCARSSGLAALGSGPCRHFARAASCEISDSSSSCHHFPLQRSLRFLPQCVVSVFPSPVRVCAHVHVVVGDVSQPAIGPFDVGGPNFGSGPNAFWPGTGSYSTFGLYAGDASKEIMPAGNLPVGSNGVGPLVCPGGMCPLGVSTPAFPPGTPMSST